MFIQYNKLDFKIALRYNMGGHLEIRAVQKPYNLQ